MDKTIEIKDSSGEKHVFKDCQIEQKGDMLYVHEFPESGGSRIAAKFYNPVYWKEQP